MIKIVVDTNVFLSGILSPGQAPAKLLELILTDKVRLVISPQIIQEISRVIRYPRIIKLLQKRNLTTQEVEQVILNILRIASITPGEIIIPQTADDPADDIFLACALEGQADYIISGDHHLTDLKEFQGVKILTPAAGVYLLSD
jgi:putative PIN family toxin of toxin-antitoxin system